MSLIDNCLSVLHDYRDVVLSKYPGFLSSYEYSTSVVERFLQMLAQTKDSFFCSDAFPAHITVSAWVMDSSFEYFLLCYHKKICKWIPLGGHFEPHLDSSLFAGSLREASEESGIARKHLKHLDPASFLVCNGSDILPFDLDIHEIPAFKNQPKHEHYDMRFLLLSQSSCLQAAEEQQKVMWCGSKDIYKLTNEYSTLRQMLKVQWLKHVGGD